MRVVVIGSGAMGCRFGAALFRAGNEVWLYDVSKPHVEAINQNGLCICQGEKQEYLKIPATTSIADVGTPDLAILFTKSIYTQAALESTSGCFGEHTAVLTLQNGLGNIEQIRRYVKPGQIIAGITNYATDLLGPGRIGLTGDGIVRIMPMDQSLTPVAEDVARDLTRGGCNTVISQDVMKDIWEKVAFNAAFNSLTCITLLPVGGVGGAQEGKALALAIGADVARIANADGVAADEEHVRNNILSVIGPHADHKPSMLQDRLAGRRTEVDAIVGAVIEKGRRHGMDTTRLETIYALVKTIEHDYLKK